MSNQDQFRQALEDLDIPLLRRMWAELMPHLPQPETDADALVAAHHARTQALSVTFRARAYSHRWLVNNGYPSGLPDQLRPTAERVYPKTVEGVLVCVAPTHPGDEALAKAIERVMSNAIAEAYADGKTDPEFVRARMKEAREKLTGRPE